MAYAQGTATGVNDLMAKINAFCVSQGWVVNRYVLPQTGQPGVIMSIQKGTQFVNFRSFVNESLFQLGTVNPSNFTGIGVYGSDGYSSNAFWSEQPGGSHMPGKNSLGFFSNLTLPITQYYFFSYPDIDEIHLIIQYTPGNYQYMGFGKLKPFGSDMDARWYAGSVAGSFNFLQTGKDAWSYDDAPLFPFRNSCRDRSNVSFDDQCASGLRVKAQNIDTWYRDKGNQAFSSACYDYHLERIVRAPTGWQSRLLPNVIFAASADKASCMPMGEIKHLRRMAGIANYTDTEEFALGSDTWKVFPYHSRSFSGDSGYAVRKVI